MDEELTVHTILEQSDKALASIRTLADMTVTFYKGLVDGGVPYPIIEKSVSDFVTGAVMGIFN